MRKQGMTTAQAVQQGAATLLALYNEQSDIQTLTQALLAFDQDLKAQGINPGTSADLTVATLFAIQLQELIDNQFTADPLWAAFNTREYDRTNSGNTRLVF